MGTLLSPCDGIQDIRFERFPTRMKRGMEVVRQGDILLGRDAQGKLFATGELGKNNAYLPGNWLWVDDALKGLVKLGVLTQAHMQLYLDHCKAAKRRGDAQHCLKYDLKALAEFGVQLTAAQRAPLEAAAEGRE